MSVVYVPIPLFSEDNFSNCIIVPFPEGGKIVDTIVADRIAYLLVEARPGAKNITAHFHVVPVLNELYADSYEYVGTFQISGFRGTDMALLTVIRIPEGDFGVFSAEFVARFGEEARDKIIAEAQSELKPESETFPSNDDELRKIWDFDTGKDKNESDNDDETEMES
jgi:hypothetical protein